MAQNNQEAANPINNPPQVEGGTPGFGNMRRDFGSALMKSGASILAEAVAENLDSPAMGQAIIDLTSATTDMMHERFWKSEFENFQQTYGQQYQVAAQQIMAQHEEAEAALGNDFSDKGIQARNQGMQDLISKVQQLDVQFMQNAAKFGNNPIIGNVANQLMQQRAQWMSSMLGSYKDVLGDAEARLTLQKAQHDTSPEMLELDTQQKQVNIQAKQAQIGESQARSGLLRAQAQKAQQGEIGADLANVPAGKLSNWLLADPKGQKVLLPYAQSAEAKLRERLVQQDPSLKGDTEAIDNKVRIAAPTIRKEAVAAALQDILPADAYAAILKDNNRVSSSLLKEETPTASPSIAQQYSVTELNRLVEGDKKANVTGLGEGLLIKKAEELARTGNFKTIQDLKKKIKEEVAGEVNDMVADFKGNEKTKARLSKALIDYFDDNWARSDYLADEYGGGTGILGRVKRAQMAAEDIGFEAGTKIKSLLGK